MQENHNAGAERDKRQMVALLNSGDKRELRAFMQLYSKQIYERAFNITQREPMAKDATRRVLSEVAALAARGALKENIDVQLMSLTDQICSEALFHSALVDGAMRTGAAAADRQPPEPIPSGTELFHRELSGMGIPVLELPEEEEEEDDNAEPLAQAGTLWFADDDAEEAFQEETQPEDALPQEHAFVPQSTQVPRLFDDADEPRKARHQPHPAAEADAGEGNTSPMLVIGIILFSILIVMLVWILVVKLMTTGVLPNYDFGFARWFNTHIFELY